MKQLQIWATPLAVLFAGLCIAGSVVFMERWEVAVVASANSDAVYRLDRWTGHVELCEPDIKTAQEGGFYYYTCPVKVP